jgi:hypothetical protein
MGMSRLSLMVSPWLWQRMAPTRTHKPSTAMGFRLAAEDLVGLDVPLPLLAALAVAQVRVDPGQEAAGERDTEVLRGEIVFAQDAGHLAVDVEDRRGGIVEEALGGEVQLAHLLQQLAHVLRAGAARRLVGHRRDPLDQVGLEQPVDRHEHEAHGAVAADEVLARPRDRLVDHGLFTGSRMMTASLSMRSAEAASIQ